MPGWVAKQFTSEINSAANGQPMQPPNAAQLPPEDRPGVPADIVHPFRAPAPVPVSPQIHGFGPGGSVTGDPSGAPVRGTSPIVHLPIERETNPNVPWAHLGEHAHFPPALQTGLFLHRIMNGMGPQHQPLQPILNQFRPNPIQHVLQSFAPKTPAPVAPSPAFHAI